MALRWTLIVNSRNLATNLRLLFISVDKIIIVDERPHLKPPAKSPPPELEFDLLPGLVGYHLRQAQIAMFNDFIKTMSEDQVTPGQFGVIVLIDANPGLTQSALARAVGIERSTMVAVIDNLESRGLVERRPSPVDRRSYALVLSAKGRDHLARLKPLVREHEDRIAAGLTLDERRLLIDLLSRVGGS